LTFDSESPQPGDQAQNVMTTATKKLTFRRGGVHPPERKDLTEDLPLVVSQPPAQVAVLMLQHIGAPAAPLVKKKDKVDRGQLIGESQGFISANVHSPVSGVVKAVEGRTHNPTGRPVPTVIIESDGEDRWADGCNEPQDIEQMDAAGMVDLVKEAGVVGLGGASFPTNVKLSPPPGTAVTDVIINGAECEPYLTCDHRLMVERPDELAEALRLIVRIVGAERGHVAIESNKPDAIEKLTEATAGDAAVTVWPLQVKYPQGAEQQVISAVTGREVPSGGGLPHDVGCLVQNVATALAVRDAVLLRRPLIERALTVTGEGVASAGNFVERIGASIGDILRRQGLNEDCNLLIAGGPMMGIAQRALDVPLIKANSGLLARLAGPVPPQKACIRCGRCVEHCPLGLTPGQLSIVCERMDWDAAVALDIMECKECGCCAYVCPAKRRIVQLIRLGKAELAKKRRQQAK